MDIAQAPYIPVNQLSYYSSAVDQQTIKFM
jgi:hypothetical protein